ncbi:hypothetical protein CDES_14080 [Corynebacterium deserti GIMN1.010]|uniref:Uncharacterized protein n=1 Tax=Corynebacterium deserti GIMN1.010 TaxID=931089 RepID=A0A0M4CFW4_9CORY|nr:hypothetical protein CDES_14080 [Corynebacterium deserti GIMN1.010]
MWPLKKTVMKPGEPTIDYDRFGNEIIRPGVPVEVNVVGWEVTRSTEGDPDSILRTVDELQIFAPPGTFAASDVVTLPDGGEWNIEGNPIDSTNGPWWNPGLVIFRAKKVDG